MNITAIFSRVRSDRIFHRPVNIGHPPSPPFHLAENRCRATYLLVLFLGCSLLAGCDYPQDYVDLMNLPPEKRHLEFRKLPIEKQVEFYLIRATHSHPQDRRFANDIAARGEETLPYLLERLEKEPKDYDKYNIIWIFRQIHIITIDLRNRKEVIGALERTAEKMKDPFYKEESHIALQFIKEVTPEHAK